MSIGTTLTLPGTIPGLLRRGSPVSHPRSPQTPCVVVEARYADGNARVGYPWSVNHEDGDYWPLSMLALDLADATGRAHAAWWLLAHLCPKPEPRVLPGWCAGWSEEDLGVWVLSGLGRVWSFTGHPEAENTLDADVEMRIAGLRFLVDTRIPRLLPDSSRWVDAEALRRVVLHVAGVSP